jgi:hypothetical protein
MLGTLKRRFGIGILAFFICAIFLGAEAFEAFAKDKIII